MATIITVHGTYADGPEFGQLWWQRGSPFETQMRDLVEGEDGKLDFEPFRWNGYNSEVSRINAGFALVEHVANLEQQQKRYAIVGHSHGGSVILAALTQCIYRRRPLPGLSRWITVGTPFIAFARKTFLFSRLGVFGKAAWVSWLTFCALLLVGMGITYQRSATKDTLDVIKNGAIVGIVFMLVHGIVGWSVDRRLARAGRNLNVETRPLSVGRMSLLRRVYLAFALYWPIALYEMGTEAEWRLQQLPTRLFSAVAILAAPFVIVAVARWAMHTFRFFGRVRRRELAARTFARWLAFRHPQDEAVEGLQQVSRTSFPIFGRDFATAPLTLMAVLMVPLLTVAALLTPSFMLWFTNLLALPQFNILNGIESGRLVGAGHDVRANLLALLALPAMRLLSTLDVPKLTEGDGIAFAVLFGAPILFLLGAIVIVVVSRVMAAAVSRVFSRILNTVAWNQIRTSAYGNDTQGEISVTARESPEIQLSYPALPPALANEISAVADAAAAGTLSKFRASLNRLAFAADRGSQSNLVTDYLSWDELIHTAYFKVPLFNKYVAYVIANSEGFKPTARFLADPDYLRLAAWYADYHVREQGAGAAQKTA